MREDVQAALAKVDKAWSPEHINWCAASSTLTFPGGRGHYEQIGRLLLGTWTCGRGPAARGSGMVSLESKLG